MTDRTSGRAALVIAASLLLFLTGAPTRAAEKADGEAVEQTKSADKPATVVAGKMSRARKASRAQRAAKYAALKAAKAKAAERKAAQAGADAKPNIDIPPSVANANAQLTGADARGEAGVTSAPALEIAAADQLSELGRSLSAPVADDEPRRITTQLVMNDRPELAMPITRPEPQQTVGEASQPGRIMHAASSDGAWAQSSLIGKIFIAFGGLLTLVSAGRMLVA